MTDVVLPALLALSLMLGRVVTPPLPSEHPPARLDLRAPAPAPALSARERWAWIVMGESGGGWPEGSLLVSWTLRAWQLNKGMPADMAGPRWGWNGWKRPNAQAEQAVAAAWGRPLSEAPFEFMQAGRYCANLGSASDVRYWQSIGLFGTPDYTLAFGDSGYSMNCYLSP